MDNNLRTVKKDDLKTFIYDTFVSYGVHLAGINVFVNSLYIRIECDRNKLDRDDINGINNALAELFNVNVFLSDPRKIDEYCNGNCIPLLHPFDIVE